MLAARRGFLFSAALCAAMLGAPAAPAGAQSLALSYKLDPVSAPQSPNTFPAVNRCTGLTWVVSLAAVCIAEATAARLVSAVNALRAELHAGEEPADAGASRRVSVPGSYSAAEVAAPRYDLPVLGSPSEARVLRAAGGRDDYIANARSMDVNFRFGSKHRLRSAEEGWEVYRFSDVASENRLQSNSVKNIGVELLFPFQ